MNLTKSRKHNPDCNGCDKMITRNELAYDDSVGSRKIYYHLSCGKLEKDYSNADMNRPSGVTLSPNPACVGASYMGTNCLGNSGVSVTYTDGIVNQCDYGGFQATKNGFLLMPYESK